MKKILIALACVATVGAFAQGQFVAENRDTGNGVDAPVSLNGVRASGTTLNAQFYVGPAGSLDSALTAVGQVYNFKTTTSASGPGYLADKTDSTANAQDTITVPGIAGGVNAVVELRAWVGAATSGGYASATTKGSSAPLTITLGNPNSSPPGTPTSPSGLAGFNVTAVPEPATLALGGIGAAALLFRRRKQA